MNVSTMYCTQCQRVVYVGRHDPGHCPVCSSPLVGEAAPEPLLQDRLSRNEVVARSLNENIEDATTERGASRAAFICECTDRTCDAQIFLSSEEYERVRADARTFIVSRGHEDLRIEVVVAKHSTHNVVEKIGQAADTAEALDPRSPAA